MTRQDLGDGQLLDPGRRPECLEVQGPEEPLVQVEVLEAHALLGDLEGRAAVSLELEIITDRLARLPMFGGQGQGLVGGVSLPEEMIQMGHTALEDGLSGAIPFVDMILLVPVPFFPPCILSDLGLLFENLLRERHGHADDRFQILDDLSGSLIQMDQASGLVDKGPHRSTKSERSS